MPIYPIYSQLFPYHIHHPKNLDFSWAEAVSFGAPRVSQKTWFTAVRSRSHKFICKVVIQSNNNTRDLQEQHAGSPSFSKCYTLEIIRPNGQRHDIFNFFNYPFCHLAVFHLGDPGTPELVPAGQSSEQQEGQESQPEGSADEASKISWCAL